jgi:XTP/dITP diphosphohydrolase
MTEEFKTQAANSFLRLLQIMEDLREKCPWDKKQTIDSIRHLTIEETYELADAIMEKNMTEVRKELGDLLLHIVFYSKIASETNAFDIRGVINGICDKLIERHPHVYGEVKADTEEAVKRNWELIKLREKSEKNTPKTVLGGIPTSLPAMIKAYRIQEKARGVGFDWDNKEQVWQKVEEELAELKAEIQYHDEDLDMQKVEDEFGDLFFSLINYARFLGINPVDALDRSNQKFIRRFNYIESQSQKEGKSFEKMTLSEMEAYWGQAKKLEK